MPIKALTTLFVITIHGLLFSQRTQVNLSLNLGPHAFVNKKQGQYLTGSSSGLGINIFLSKPRQVMIFKPQLNFVTNTYASRLNTFDAWIRIKQSLTILNLDVLLKIAKTTYLKTGLFFGSLVNTTIELRYKTATNAHFAYSNSHYFKSYSPTPLQAGFTMGLSLPFKIKTAELKFNTAWVQYVTPIVSSNYHNPEFMGKENKAIYSSSVKPTSIILGLEYALRKSTRPINKDE